MGEELCSCHFDQILGFIIRIDFLLRCSRVPQLLKNNARVLAFVVIRFYSMMLINPNPTVAMRNMDSKDIGRPVRTKSGTLRYGR